MLRLNRFWERGETVTEGGSHLRLPDRVVFAEKKEEKAHKRRGVSDLGGNRP